MPAETTRVIARLRAKEGQETALQEVLEGLIGPTRAEAGCLLYELWQDRADPASFTFVEEWTSDEALAAHGETDHIQSGRAAMSDLLAEPLDLELFKLLA